MKKDKKGAVRPKDLIRALDKALAHASGLRGQIEDLRRDPYRQIPLLEEALEPLEQARTRISSADTEGWSETDFEKFAGARNRVEHALEPLISLRDKGPQLLRDQVILIKDDEVFRQELPGEEDGDDPDDVGETHCCFTRIRVENILRVKIRVTAVHENGATVTRELACGRSGPLTMRDGRNRVIPGGLGRCVTFRVELEDADGTWTPAYSGRICCDDDPPPDKGTRIRLTRPVAGGSHMVQITPLEITDKPEVVECPPGEDGDAGTSAHGTASSGIWSIPGLIIGDRQYYFGAWARTRYVPRAGGCRNFCFVQGKIREVKLQRPGQQEPRPAPLLGTGDRFVLDQLDSQRTPCYPFVEDLPGGGREMRDFPGVENPWGRVSVDGQDSGKLEDGTIMIVKWTFRT